MTHGLLGQFYTCVVAQHHHIILEYFVNMGVILAEQTDALHSPLHCQK